MTSGIGRLRSFAGRLGESRDLVESGHSLTYRANMLEANIDPDLFVRLSAQRALLGMVPSALRVVTAEFVGTEVQICFVFDGAIEEDDVESARLATTQIIADFPAPWTLAERFVRLDYPAELVDYPHIARVYERKERTSEGVLLG